MDSLSYQKLGRSSTSDACIVTYNKAGLLTDFSKGVSGTKGDDFQKLMEKAQSSQTDSSVEDRPKAESKDSTGKKADKTPAQKKEDAYEEAVKQGIVQIVGQVPADMVLEPVTLVNPETGENIPLAMDNWAPQVEMNGAAAEEIEAFTGEIDMPRPIDVSDPKADAMLEATAPGADNSPAAMLEKVVAEQTGQEIQPDAGEAQGRQQDDGDVELVDVEQAPQQIFHDVKAAPVKVGEVERPQQVDEPDVVQQLDGQIGLAIEQGNSSVTVRLNPENLGEVTIQISVKDNGILAVALNAKNDATRALLDRHSDNLQQLLSSRVRETVEVDVQRQSESQQGQNQQNYDGRNGHAQDGQERRRRQQEPASSQDFMQQLRLGLIPTDGEL